MATKDELDKFLNQVRALQDIHFPDAAKLVGLNYHKDIKPELEKRGWFYVKMLEVLEEIKFHLLGKLLKTAKLGRGVDAPDPTSINAIIKLIDSGALLGIKPEVEVPIKENSSLSEEELRKLGL